MGAHEDEYLRMVGHELRDLPRGRRRELLDVTSTLLEERPDAATFEELIDALGSTPGHARRLRADHGLPARVPLLLRLSMTPLRTRVAMVVVPLVLLGAGLWAWSWWTAVPALHSYCAGVDRQDHDVTVEQRQAATTSEYLIGYVDEAEVRLYLCLSSPERVEVRDVVVRAAPLSLWEPTGWRAYAEQAGTDPRLLDEPGDPFTLDDSGWRVELIGRLTDCEFYVEGSSNSFEGAEVTYRYRGRTRTSFVPFATTYSFVSPPDSGCPRLTEVRAD